MSNQKRVKSFLGRLETSVNKCNGMNALKEREQQNLSRYQKNKVWPGSDYMYMGHSENLEHPLLGTENEFKRKTCLALLFEARGDANYCVRLEEALNFDGFLEGLSRFERELLYKLPPDTLLGPSYDCEGDKLPSAFTIWRLMSEQKNKKRILVQA